MNSLTESWEGRLKEQGYRLTKPRRAVLEALVAEPICLTPEEIYHRARKHYKKLGLVTVYRTLALFEKLGLVQRVHVDTGCHSFAVVRFAEGHHHQLVCRDCGRVEEFTDCTLDSMLADLQKRTGFAIETHQLEVVGRCPDCQ